MTKAPGPLAGVCAGLAAFLGWKARAVRALFVVVGLLTAGVPVVVAYTLLAISMPPHDPDGRGRFNLDDFRVQ
ncbi:MAG TPA: PspC domain-containing protein [Lysobacter sp.]|nr:PspC domain-containing protein [Lysobacter sp.]